MLVGEICTGEIHVRQPDAVKAAASVTGGGIELGQRQVRPGEVGGLYVGAAEVRGAESCGGKIRVTQIGAHEIGAADIGGGEIGAAQVLVYKIRPGQVRVRQSDAG